MPDSKIAFVCSKPTRERNARFFHAVVIDILLAAWSTECSDLIEYFTTGTCRHAFVSRGENLKAKDS